MRIQMEERDIGSFTDGAIGFTQLVKVGDTVYSIENKCKARS